MFRLHFQPAIFALFIGTTFCFAHDMKASGNARDSDIFETESKNELSEQQPNGKTDGQRLPACEIGSGIHVKAAFSTYFSHNANLNRGDTLVFDKVLLNEGNMYDVRTGVVTIPIDGVYSFYFSIWTIGDTWVEMLITLDGEKVVEARPEGTETYMGAQGGNMAIIRANKGQRVQVKKSSGFTVNGSATRMTTFSGHLIYVA